MRIGYALITRVRPMALICAAMTAWKLRSKQHDLRMALAIDTDDAECQEAAFRLSKEFPLWVSVEDPPLSIGSKWNRLSTSMTDCDLISFMTERMIPLTEGWDNVLATTATSVPDRPFYWSSPADPGFAAPAIPRRWLEAASWRPLTERFPFWFTDTWLTEVQALVFGFPHAFTPAVYGGERKATMACRDVEFWVEYYAWLYPERVTEAQRLSAVFGYEWREPSKLVAEKIAYRTNYLRAHAKDLQSTFADPNPPSERYLAALAAARNTMEAANARQIA